MRPIWHLSLPERVAEHLREGIREGRWSGRLPGVPHLAAELDVGRHTIRRALRLMEAEGLLGGRGSGRSREIAASLVTAATSPLRVAILRHDPRLTDNAHTSMILSEIMAARNLLLAGSP